jgi:sugar lactone lactonase YvrE
MPDGCSLDKDGCIWMADAMNSRAVRVAENKGIIDQINAPPGMGLYSCAVGGDDGRELLVCTAPDYDDVKRAASRDAVLYVARLDG